METKEGIKFYFGVIAGILAFIIIAGGFILVFIRYRKGLILKQQEMLRLDARHKQELLANNIESAEAERMSIAKDIHDEIGSIFSTLSLSINQLKAGTVVNMEMVQHSNRLIEMGISGVRRIAHSLIPFELELLGLSQALENHFETIERLSDIEINFTKTESLDTLTDKATLAIYRIVQELSSNCIKYAAAKHIRIAVEEQNGLLLINYKDDGKGTSMENRALKKGIGLKNIESRVIILDGEVNFASEPGKGFTCNIRIPLLKNKNHD
jgi:signal transduction histidine kinase